MTPTPKDIEAAEKLERCRFCGKEAEIEYLSDPFERGSTRIDANMAKVICVDLNCISNIGYMTRDKAIAAWNDMSKAATAQALAAAREEGRSQVLEHLAKSAEQCDRLKMPELAKTYLEMIEEILNLPTNAPEGESDEPADLADCENWFRLSPRESETRTCATDNCLNPPSYRFEASGIGSDYCMNCASTIQKQALKSLPTKEQ